MDVNGFVWFPGLMCLDVWCLVLPGWFLFFSSGD